MRATRPALTLLLVALLAGPSTAVAEIEKVAETCGQGICLHWWPRLPPIKGWHHDRDQSIHYGANALAPDGHTFADAESVIYARAVSKPRTPETKSLEGLIEADKAEFRAHDSTIKIEESKPVATADGQKLRTFEYAPNGTGTWERVAYGEEGEFYLLFTVSARSEGAYKAAQKVYEDLIERYRAKP